MIDLQTLRSWRCQVWLYTCTHRSLVLRLHGTEILHEPDERRYEYFVVCCDCTELPRVPTWSVARMHKHRVDDFRTLLWDEESGASIDCYVAYVRLGFDNAIHFLNQPLESPSVQGFVNAPDDVLPDGRD